MENNTSHYHVLIGLQGCYMPDTNHVCDNYQDARDVVAWYLNREREDGVKVRTHCKGWAWTIGDHNMIEISEGCNHSECLEDLGE